MRVNFRKIMFAGIIAALLTFPSIFPGRADAAGENGKNGKKEITVSEKIAKSDSPIHITADRLEARQNERTMIFEGHVVVKQDDSTVTGNRMKVVALPPEKGKPAGDSSSMSEKIDYIEMEGDVKVTQKDRLAAADKAIFYQQEQKIVMRGHPSVTQGKDKIEGTLITIYLQQNRSVVEGGREAPVQAVLFPKKD